jgi:hypothetical protein
MKEPVCSCGHEKKDHEDFVEKSGMPLHFTDCKVKSKDDGCACRKYQPVAPEMVRCPNWSREHCFNICCHSDTHPIDDKCIANGASTDGFCPACVPVEPASQILDLDIDTNSKGGWTLNKTVPAPEPKQEIVLSPPIYGNTYEERELIYKCQVEANLRLDEIRAKDKARIEELEEAFILLDKCLKPNTGYSYGYYSIDAYDWDRVKQLAKLKAQASEVKP